jgi:hypothetical protein
MLFDYKLREGVVTKSSLVDLPVVIAKPCVLCGLDLAGGVTVARGSARFAWFLCGNRRARIFIFAL